MERLRIGYMLCKKAAEDKIVSTGDRLVRTDVSYNLSIPSGSLRELGLRNIEYGVFGNSQFGYSGQWNGGIRSTSDLDYPLWAERTNESGKFFRILSVRVIQVTIVGDHQEYTNPLCCEPPSRWSKANRIANKTKISMDCM